MGVFFNFFFKNPIKNRSKNCVNLSNTLIDVIYFKSELNISTFKEVLIAKMILSNISPAA